MLQPGSRGLLLTCFWTKEAATTREAYHILQAYDDSDGLNCSSKNEDGSPSGDKKDWDMETALRQEVADLKRRSTKTFLAHHLAHVSCMVFVECRHLKLTPTDIVDDLYRREVRTRHCQRILPLDIVVQAHAADVVAALKKLVARFKAENRPSSRCSDGDSGKQRSTAKDSVHDNDSVARVEKDPEVREGNKDITASYAVIFERRMSSAWETPEQKAALIRQIAAEVLHPADITRVDLQRPDLVVMLQVIRGVVGLALLPDYYQRRKLNFSLAVDK